MSLINLPEWQRHALVEEAREVFRAIWSDDEVRETHACLYHAVCLQGVIAKRTGARTMIQAGTCQWPMCRPEDDDGERATHFSYQWEGLDHPDVARNLMKFALPELHVWLGAIPNDKVVPNMIKEPTIIDSTTGSWPKRARMAGYEWTSPEPPDYLWATLSELRALVANSFPLGVVYEADMNACMVADRFAAVGIYPDVAGYLGFGE